MMLRFRRKIMPSTFLAQSKLGHTSRCALGKGVGTEEPISRRQSCCNPWTRLPRPGILGGREGTGPQDFDGAVQMLPLEHAADNQRKASVAYLNMIDALESRLSASGAAFEWALL